MYVFLCACQSLRSGAGVSPQIGVLSVNSTSVMMHSGREPRPAPDGNGRALIAFLIMRFPVAFPRVRKHPDTVY